MKPSLIIRLIFCCLFSLNAAHADEAESKEPAQKKNEISDILDSMGYPELQVVPRASERLAIEAKSEDGGAAFSHWPIQFAGLATLVVGLTSKGNQRTDLTSKETSDAAMISSVTSAVGLGWIVGGAVMGLQRPYRSGVTAINKYPGKDERSTLMRERLAEEALEKPARTSRVMQNVAVISDVTVNVASAWHANETGKIMAGAGVLLSFVPLIFEDRSIEIYERQMDYKKKIYTPIKSAYVNFDPHSKSLTPMTGLTWNF